MELEDIRPEFGDFQLDALPNETLKLRKLSIDDRLWIKQRLGRGLEDILKGDDGNHEGLIDAYCIIAYRLIENKEHFIKTEVTIVDDEGEEKKEFLGGLTLFKRMVCSPKEQIAIMKAVSKTIAGSNPIPKEKKTLQEVKKKSA